MKFAIRHALASLRPGSPCVVRENGTDGAEIEWHDKNKTQPTDAEIQVEILRLEKEWDSNKPMRDWKEKIAETDAGMPRYFEDLITDKFAGDAGTSLQERYLAKIKIRGERP